ncbi:MAG: hypothetical protein Q9188_007331 [Gyalolechia gomerana]
MAAQPGLLLTVASKASELGSISVPEGDNSAPAKDHPASPGWNEWNAYMRDDLYTPTGFPGADANGAASPPIPSNKATDIEHGVVGVNDKPADSSFTAPQATATNAPTLPNNQAVCTDHTVLRCMDGLEAGIAIFPSDSEPNLDNTSASGSLSSQAADTEHTAAGSRASTPQDPSSQANEDENVVGPDGDERVVGSDDKPADTSPTGLFPPSIVQEECDTEGLDRLVEQAKDNFGRTVVKLPCDDIPEQIQPHEINDLFTRFRPREWLSTSIIKPLVSSFDWNADALVPHSSRIDIDKDAQRRPWSVPEYSRQVILPSCYNNH